MAPSSSVSKDARGREGGKPCFGLLEVSPKQGQEVPLQTESLQPGSIWQTSPAPVLCATDQAGSEFHNKERSEPGKEGREKGRRRCGKEDEAGKPRRPRGGKGGLQAGTQKVKISDQAQATSRSLCPSFPKAQVPAVPIARASPFLCI